MPGTTHVTFCVLRDDDSTDIDGRVSSVPLKRLLTLRGGFNPVALAGSLAKSSASFFIKPAVEDYFGKSGFVTDIKKMIKFSAVGVTVVQLAIATVLNMRFDEKLDGLEERFDEKLDNLEEKVENLKEKVDKQSELLAPLSDEAQERRLEGCPLPVIIEDPATRRS